MPYGVAALLVSVVALAAVARPSLAIFRSAPAGPAEWPPLDVAWNLGLIAIFGLQHSLLARPRHRRWHVERFPPHTERITYVLTSCLAFALVIGAWRTLPGTVWVAGGALAGTVVTMIGLAGWAFAAWSVLAMSASDIIGWSALVAMVRGRPWAPPRFRVPGPYRFVRHPIMLGLIVGLWASPAMSADRLLFSAGMTVYAVIGIVLEERDLEVEFGEPYREYRRRVPMLVPVPGRFAARSVGES